MKLKNFELYRKKKITQLRYLNIEILFIEWKKLVCSIGSENKLFLIDCTNIFHSFHGKKYGFSNYSQANFNKEISLWRIDVSFSVRSFFNSLHGNRL